MVRREMSGLDRWLIPKRPQRPEEQRTTLPWDNRLPSLRQRQWTSVFEWCPPAGPCGTAHLDVRRCTDSAVKTFCAFSSLPILWKMKKCRIYFRDYYALGTCSAGGAFFPCRADVGEIFNPHKLKIKFRKVGVRVLLHWTMYECPKSPLSTEV